MKKALFYFLMLFPLLCLTACSKDDNDSSNDEKDTPQNDEIAVVIGEDGKTSNGSLYVPIDDKSFYLDYIKYSVEESHLAVTGHDKTGLKKDAQIVSKITWKGTTYTVCTIKSRAFYDCKELLSITIPNSVTRIDTLSFYNCASLTGITFPNSMKYIGVAAFEGCDRLSSISIPSSVTTIELSAFSWCEALERIVVEAGNPVYDSRDNCNAIIETKTNKMIAGCVNTKIPSSVTALEYTFLGCTRLTGIDIPNSVKTIGSHAFSCSSLTEVQIPSSVKKIDEFAFRSCYYLTTVDIPNSVTSIGEKAFYLCRALTSVALSSSLVMIGDNAFQNCTKLNKIHSRMTRPVNFSYEVFDESVYEKAILYIPSGSSYYYNNTANWYLFRNIEEM